MCENLTQNGEPQRFSSGTHKKKKKKKKKMKPTDKQSNPATGQRKKTGEGGGGGGMKMPDIAPRLCFHRCIEIALVTAAINFVSRAQIKTSEEEKSKEQRKGLKEEYNAG